MYKRSSTFHNKLWPSPRTRTRKAEKVNADLLALRNVTVAAPPPELSSEEKEHWRDVLRNLVGNIAGDLSAAEFLQPLSSADLESIAAELVLIGDLPSKISISERSSDAEELAGLKRSEAIRHVLPVIEKLLREARVNQERNE
jgi:hypothetical protein